VIGHAKESLVDFFQRESRAQCGSVICGVLAEAVHRAVTVFALCSFGFAGGCRGSTHCLRTVLLDRNAVAIGPNAVGCQQKALVPVVA
jgi:hypothetical protein